MTERKRGYSLDDLEAQEERSRLGGLCWASWRHNVINYLENNNRDSLKPEDEEILHMWFVLRREVQLNQKTGQDLDDFIKDSGIRNLPDDLKVVKGMAFITNRLRRDR